MTLLTLLLLIKILGTLVPVALPLLLLSKTTLDRLSGLTPSDVTLYRLYGIAIVALLVGYAGGIVQVRAGDYPTGVLWMGLTSNAGATLALLRSRAAPLVRGSALFFGLITAGLIAALAAPDVAMRPLG